MIDLSVPKRNLSIAVHHVACRAAAAVPRRRGVLVDEAARDYAGAAELRRPGAAVGRRAPRAGGAGEGGAGGGAAAAA